MRFLRFSLMPKMKQNTFIAFTTILLLFAVTACASSVTPSAVPDTPLPQPTAILISPTGAIETQPPSTSTDEPSQAPPSAATDAPAQVVPTATIQPTPASPTNPAPAQTDSTFTLGVQPFVKGFSHPVFITPAPDNSGRFFVVEQGGQIRIIANGQRMDAPFLDVSSLITTAGSEQGLLGMAFDPNFSKNGTFYINYSRKGNGDNVVARYQISSDANVADPNSAKILLTIPGFEVNHNSGMLAFGPDGYLYIGAGDGGGAGDQHGTIGNGQDLNALNGKLLRIDVNGDPYNIPPTNPFVNQSGARPEIWAYGLRNPWRFSFDQATGDLYIADVGQAAYEEVDFQAAGDKGGENYGWRMMEGMHCYNPSSNCDTSGKVRPILEYTHDSGSCSITGGYVYRGQQYPWLGGEYIFGDYCSGILWATARDASGKWQTRQVGNFNGNISSFGQDTNGEIFVVGHQDGTIYKLTSQQ
jgi:glucose/arabinose dehydrogenase